MEDTKRKRRSHPKSRKGCYACKARRAKCNEVWPSCELCLWHGTDCVYPQTKTKKEQPQALACRQILPAPAEHRSLELRYFHHFLNVAYPVLPLDNEQVWITRVPQLANQNPDVMSALLGLSAAHLACVNTSSEHKTRAIVYRGRSLAALNGALSNTEWTHAEADSALAIVYLLASQSQYLEDGLFEFMTMIRGSMLLSRYFVRSGCETTFDLITTIAAPTVPESVVPRLPSLDVHSVEKGLSALSLLLPMLQSHEQIQLYLSIKGIFQACLHSTRQGFEEYWNALDYSVPTSFTSPDVFVKILQTFLIALRLFLQPITLYVFPPPGRPLNTLQEVRSVTIEWARKIFKDIPPRMRKFVEWSEAVVEQEMSQSKWSTPEDQVVAA